MAKKRQQNDPVVEEQEAIEQSEPAVDEQGTDQNIDETQVEARLVETGADADAVLPAEAAAVHTDTDSAHEASGDMKKAKPAKSSKIDRKKKQKKQRSAKYQAATAKHDRGVSLSLSDAIKFVQATSYTKFDGAVELHARLIVKKKGETESARGLVVLPSGAPKLVNAVLLTEALIDEIAATKRADADLYLATPALMTKVAKVAKILGPQGKMPNPKTGTVTTDPAAVLAEIQSGRVEFRADAQGIVHVSIGKVSWPVSKLVANAESIIAAIGGHRLRSVFLVATMGPSISVDLTSIKA